MTHSAQSEWANSRRACVTHRAERLYEIGAAPGAVLGCSHRNMVRKPGTDPIADGRRCPYDSRCRNSPASLPGVADPHIIGGGPCDHRPSDLNVPESRGIGIGDSHRAYISGAGSWSLADAADVAATIPANSASRTSNATLPCKAAALPMLNPCCPFFMSLPLSHRHFRHSWTPLARNLALTPIAISILRLV